MARHDLGMVRGPQGPQGPQGPPGKDGVLSATQNGYNGKIVSGDYIEYYGRAFILQSQTDKSTSVLLPENVGTYAGNIQLTKQNYHSNGELVVSDFYGNGFKVTCTGDIFEYSQYFYWSLKVVKNAPINLI